MSIGFSWVLTCINLFKRYLNIDTFLPAVQSDPGDPQKVHSGVHIAVTQNGRPKIG